MRRQFQQALEVLLHLEDTPHRTALAFAIGVWIAFFPIWGIHTVMALAIGFLFRLNRAALVVGAWLNNPWTMAPLYTAGTVIGCFLVGASPEGLHAVNWSLHGVSFVRALMACLRPYVWPFLIGNTVVGILAGSVAYAVLRHILDRRAPAPA